MADDSSTCPRCKTKLSGGIRCPACGLDLSAARAHAGASFAQTLMSALPSRMLGGYVIEDALSSSARRAVLRARSAEDPERIIAIKAVAHDRTSPAVQGRLIERARRAVDVRHDSLATLLCVAADPGLGVAYFVSELAPGEDLAKRGAMSPAEVAEVGLAVVTALEALHAAGAVHMDVKPAHIVLDVAHARLVETGFAPVLLSASRHGETAHEPIVGTPTYVAPEQAKDVTAASPQSDLYSLGATLFHLLAGRPPFIGDSAVGILVQHAARPAPPVKSLAPAAPEGLASVIDSLLSKDPAKRPSAEEVAEALGPLSEAPPPAHGPRAAAHRPLSRRWLAQESMLAEILLEQGVATREDMRAALSPENYSPEAGRSLAEILVGSGSVAREDVTECEDELALREKCRKDAAFGRLAIELGYTTREDLDRLAPLSRGEAPGAEISEAAVRAGLLGRGQAEIVETSCLRYLCELDAAAQQRTARKRGTPAEAVTAARRALGELPPGDDRSLFEILMEQGALTPVEAWELAAEHVRQDLGVK